MSGILSSSYSAYLVALESTIGTDAVDAAITANSALVYQAINSGGTIRPAPEYERQPTARASQSGVRSSFIAAHSEISLPVPMREGVGTDFIPEYVDLMKMAGYSVASGTGTTTCTLQTANDQFGTIYKYQRNLSNNNWRLRRALGSLLTMDVAGQVGQEPVATFTGQSANHAQWTANRAYFNADDEPALDFAGSAYTYTGAATASAADPFLCENMTLTYNGVTLPAQSFNFASNMRVEPMNNMVTADTIAARIGRDRADGSNAVLSINFDMTDLGAALDDIFAAYQVDEEAAVALTLNNGTSRLRLALAAVQPRLPIESANGPAMNWDVEFHVNGDFATAPFADNGVIWTFDAAP